MTHTNKEHGEGNYKASRDYNDATKKFVESGRVDEAARKAEPETENDALQMANAEAEGRRRAKEEDPALRRKATNVEQPAGRSRSRDSQDDPRGAPVTDRSADETKTPEPGQEGK